MPHGVHFSFLNYRPKHIPGRRQMLGLLLKEMSGMFGMLGCQSNAMLGIIFSPSKFVTHLLYLTSTLQVGGEAGCRGYVAVSGGVDVPLYLGSRATFPGGKLGGLQV